MKERTQKVGTPLPSDPKGLLMGTGGENGIPGSRQLCGGDEEVSVCPG